MGDLQRGWERKLAGHQQRIAELEAENARLREELAAVEADFAREVAEAEKEAQRNEGPWRVE